MKRLLFFIFLVFSATKAHGALTSQNPSVNLSHDLLLDRNGNQIFTETSLRTLKEIYTAQAYAFIRGRVDSMNTAPTRLDGRPVDQTALVAEFRARRRNPSIRDEAIRKYNRANPPAAPIPGLAAPRIAPSTRAHLDRLAAGPTGIPERRIGRPTSAHSPTFVGGRRPRPRPTGERDDVTAPPPAVTPVRARTDRPEPQPTPLRATLEADRPPDPRSGTRIASRLEVVTRPVSELRSEFDRDSVHRRFVEESDRVRRTHRPTLQELSSLALSQHRTGFTRSLTEIRRREAQRAILSPGTALHSRFISSPYGQPARSPNPRVRELFRDRVGAGTRADLRPSRIASTVVMAMRHTGSSASHDGSIVTATIDDRDNPHTAAFVANQESRRRNDEELALLRQTHDATQAQLGRMEEQLAQLLHERSAAVLPPETHPSATAGAVAIPAAPVDDGRHAELLRHISALQDNLRLQGEQMTALQVAQLQHREALGRLATAPPPAAHPPVTREPLAAPLPATGPAVVHTGIPIAARPTGTPAAHHEDGEDDYAEDDDYWDHEDGSREYARGTRPATALAPPALLADEHDEHDEAHPHVGVAGHDDERRLPHLGPVPALRSTAGAGDGSERHDLASLVREVGRTSLEQQREQNRSHELIAAGHVTAQTALIGEMREQRTTNTASLTAAHTLTREAIAEMREQRVAATAALTEAQRQSAENQVRLHQAQTELIAALAAHRAPPVPATPAPLPPAGDAAHHDDAAPIAAPVPAAPLPPDPEIARLRQEMERLSAAVEEGRRRETESRAAAEAARLAEARANAALEERTRAFTTATEQQERFRAEALRISDAQLTAERASRDAERLRLDTERTALYGTVTTRADAEITRLNEFHGAERDREIIRTREERERIATLTAAERDREATRAREELARTTASATAELARTTALHERITTQTATAATANELARGLRERQILATRLATAAAQTSALRQREPLVRDLATATATVTAAEAREPLVRDLATATANVTAVGAREDLVRAHATAAAQVAAAAEQQRLAVANARLEERLDAGGVAVRRPAAIPPLRIDALPERVDGELPAFIEGGGTDRTDYSDDSFGSTSRPPSERSEDDGAAARAARLAGGGVDRLPGPYELARLGGGAEHRPARDGLDPLDGDAIYEDFPAFDHGAALHGGLHGALPARHEAALPHPRPLSATLRAGVPLAHMAVPPMGPPPPPAHVIPIVAAGHMGGAVPLVPAAVAPIPHRPAPAAALPPPAQPPMPEVQLRSTVSTVSGSSFNGPSLTKEEWDERIATNKKLYKNTMATFYSALNGEEPPLNKKQLREEQRARKQAQKDKGSARILEITRKVQELQDRLKKQQPDLHDHPEVNNKVGVRSKYTRQQLIADQIVALQREQARLSGHTLDESRDMFPHNIRPLTSFADTVAAQLAKSKASQQPLMLEDAPQPTGHIADTVSHYLKRPLALKDAPHPGVHVADTIAQHLKHPPSSHSSSIVVRPASPGMVRRQQSHMSRVPMRTQ